MVMGQFAGKSVLTGSTILVTIAISRSPMGVGVVKSTRSRVENSWAPSGTPSATKVSTTLGAVFAPQIALLA